MRTALALLLAAAAAFANAPCDIIDPSLCVFPFPNDYFRPVGPSGVALTNYSNTTWPLDADGKIFDVSNGWNGVNGFSPAQAAITYLPNASLSGTPNLPRLWNMETSLLATSVTALINAETGERVAHWVEADHSSDEWDAADPSKNKRAFMAWPAARLNGSTRYVFAVGPVAALGGGFVQPSPAFRAMRAGASFPGIEPERQAHFEKDIFPLAEAAGLSRGSLTIAWDFTTASDATWTHNMLSMRDQALALVGDNAAYSITSKTPTPRPGVAMEVDGFITVPWFLSSISPDIGTHIVIGSDGKPELQGYNDVPFKLIIPTSVANGSKPATAQYYGHGLFGSASELTNQYLDTEADENGWVMIGVNWIGLCSEDIISDAYMVANDLSLFGFIQARLHQAQTNALLAHRMLFTSLAADPILAVNGQPVLSKASPRRYYGNSLGGIMGSVFMSLSTDTTHGVLGVPGGPFGILLPRSKDFAALFDIIRLRYDNSLARISMMSAIQEQFTYLEPGGYVNHLWKDPLPNTPQHSVLIHYGQGDAQVNWVAAEWLGRSIGGMRAFDGTMRVRNCTLFGFEFVDNSAKLNGTDGGLMQGYYFDVPAENIPLENLPCASATDTHGKTRRTAHAMEQTRVFFEQDVIYNPCGGACHEQP
ncbi:hypothetical protein FNF27_06308 [Cafeteria roenbergensis]|uniref:Uncharacterized protein n=1 Tax=Cafeteria roenbergensis TaxID=33653 RepID=A0A5A8E233_CAFRO|nr:hypothetical protein FNF27_06308 [Cafeteria roenbergensis]